MSHNIFVKLAIEKKCIIVFTFLSALIFTTSCSIPSGSPSLVVSSTSVSTSATLLQDTKMPDVSSTSTSHSPTPQPKCPMVNDQIQLDVEFDFESLDQSALNFLNAGGDPVKLNREGSYEEVSTEVLVSNLNNDVSNEVVLIASIADEDITKFLIYSCGQNEFVLSKKITFDGVWSVEIISVEQIFTENPPLIIFRASTPIGWTEEYIAVGWNGSAWKKLSLGYALFPSTIMLYDQDDDGVKEVFIKSLTSVTIGGGVGRPVVATYKWNGREYIHLEAELLPSFSRVHYLGDAQAAIDRKNPLLAVAYYEIAAENLDLSSWASLSEVASKQVDLADEYQRSFAYFRIAAIWLYLERTEMANQTIDMMKDEFPVGTPGAEFIDAVELLASLVESEIGYFDACSEVGMFLDNEYPDVMSIHIGGWNVPNTSYFSGVDVCTLE